MSLTVLAEELHLSGFPFAPIAGLDPTLAGYATTGLFVVTWALAVKVSRFGRTEERWAPVSASGDG